MTDETAQGDQGLIPYDQRPDIAQKLTPRQWAFTQHYFVDFNARAAAERAGYSARSARTLGPRTLSMPSVARVLTEMMPQMIGISRPGLLQAFMRIAGARSANYSDQIAALSCRYKLSCSVTTSRRASRRHPPPTPPPTMTSHQSAAQPPGRVASAPPRAWAPSAWAMSST